MTTSYHSGRGTRSRCTNATTLCRSSSCGSDTMMIMLSRDKTHQNSDPLHNLHHLEMDAVQLKNGSHDRSTSTRFQLKQLAPVSGEIPMFQRFVGSGIKSRSKLGRCHSKLHSGFGPNTLSDSLPPWSVDTARHTLK